MRFCSISAIVIFLILTYTQALSTVDAPQLVIGTCQPISSPCTNGNPSFTTALIPPSITTIKALGMSLIGYDTFVSSILYIDPQITQINTTQIQIQATCLNDLIFTKLQFSYIMVGLSVQYLDVYSECFLCTPRSTSDGSRAYTFGMQQHTIPFESDMKVISSISGMNASNILQNGIQLQVKTLMNIGDRKIYHDVYAYSHTVVTSICVTTIIYDQSLTSVQSFKIIVEVEEKIVDTIFGAVMILPTKTEFINVKSMYYGISEMDIFFQSASRQTVLFDMADFTNSPANFVCNANIKRLKFSAFFIRKLDCAATEFYDPFSNQCVSTCPAQSGPNPATQYCEPCYYTCATCTGSGIDKCNSCNNATINKFRQRKNGLPISQCVCQPLYFQASDFQAVCKKCSNVIQNCNLCSSATFCTQCLPGYTYNPITNKCGCTDTTKFLSKGYCLDYAGCTNVKTSTNVPFFCASCDTDLNFAFVLSNYSCQCMNGFELHLPTISCVDDCGDGVVHTDECDDGDNVDGNGCSAMCKIEDGYMCLTSIQPSKCMPEVKFELSYQYCKREITANAATFSFFLTPPSPILSQVNLTKSFTFTFAGKVTSYTYNDQTGKLQVTTTFTQTLQGSDHAFTMNFSSAGVWTEPLSAHFTVKGMNSWVIKDEFSNSYKFVIYGIAMVCGLAWVLGLIAAIIGFKNLTLELILPIQALYFVLASLGSNAPGLRALHFMNFINGYNSLSGIKMKEVVSEDDTGYSELEYMANLNYFILVDVGCVVMLFLVKGLHFAVNRKLVVANDELERLVNEEEEENKDDAKQEAKNKKNTQKGQEGKQPQPKATSLTPTLSISDLRLLIESLKFKNKITQKLLLFIGQRFACTILLLTLQSTIFYLGAFIIYTSKYRLFSPFLNNMSCLVAVMLAFIGLAVYPEEKAKEVYIVFQNNLRYSYTKLFTLWYVVFLVTLVMVCSFKLTGLMLVAIVLLCLFIGVLIVKNPYKTQKAPCLRFILPVVQHCILTAPCVMLWVVGFLKNINPFFYFIATTMILGCCSIAIILTGIRIYFEIKNFRLSKKWSKNEKDEDDQEEDEEQNDEMDVLEKGNENGPKDKSGVQKPQQVKQPSGKLKQSLLNKSEPITDPVNPQDNCQTVKGTKGKKKERKESVPQSVAESHEQEDQQSSRHSQDTVDLQAIKRKLRKDLRQKRNVLNR